MARDKKYREKGRKKTTPVYWVFCEGPTEEEYVVFLQRKYGRGVFSIQKKCFGTEISQKKIDGHLIRKNKVLPPKEEVFVFYDRDRNDINKTLDQLKGVTLVCSNPCTELWFLLHYTDWTKHIDCDTINKELSGDSCCKSYAKGGINSELEEKLASSFQDAAQRAKVLESKHENRFANPSSSVYRLLEKLGLILA